MNYMLNHSLNGEKEHYFLKNDSNMPLEHFCCEPNLDSFHHPTIVETSLSFFEKPLYISIIHSYNFELYPKSLK